MKWGAKRAVGGFTGPPVETGATLPYRELPAPTNFRQACVPTTDTSRSITSGARQPQAQMQAVTQSELGTSAPQLMFPAHTSSEASLQNQASMTLNQATAVHFPLSVATGLAPSLPCKGGLHAASSGLALPSNSAALDSAPGPKPGNWPEKGPAASYAHMLMPTPRLTLPLPGI